MNSPACWRLVASAPAATAGALLVMAALFPTAAGPLASQEPAALQIDARVRLIPVGGDRWVVGKLMMPPSDSVRLLAGDGNDSVAVATALARFELSKGRRRQTIRGAWIGAAVGGVAGFVTDSPRTNHAIASAPTSGRGELSLSPLRFHYRGGLAPAS